jgi:hypothetical protein
VEFISTGEIYNNVIIHAISFPASNLHAITVQYDQERNLQGAISMPIHRLKTTLSTVILLIFLHFTLADATCANAAFFSNDAKTYVDILSACHKLDSAQFSKLIKQWGYPAAISKISERETVYDIDLPIEATPETSPTLSVRMENDAVTDAEISIPFPPTPASRSSASDVLFLRGREYFITLCKQFEQLAGQSSKAYASIGLESEAFYTYYDFSPGQVLSASLTCAEGRVYVTLSLVAEQPEAQTLAIVTADDGNLHKGPGLKDPVLEKAKKGETFILRETRHTTDEFPWYRIRVFYPAWENTEVGDAWIYGKFAMPTQKLYDLENIPRSTKRVGFIISS